MIIEFVGYPCSGKSSIINHIDSKYICECENNNWLLRNAKKICKSVIYYFFNFKKCNTIIYLIYSSKQKRKLDFFRLLLNNIYLLNYYSEIDENTCIVVDEGIIQHLWAILIGSTNKFDIKKYINLFQKEISVIYIKISKDEFIGRFQNRNVKNGRKYKINKRHVFLFNEIINNFVFLDDLFNVLKINNKYEVNNNCSLDEASKIVNKILEEIENED